MTYRGILAAFLLWPLAAFGQTYPSPTFSKITVNIPITASSTTGAINYGALPYSDTGNFGVMVGNTNSFLQWTLLNLSTGTTASADYIVGNSTTTASTHYGDFGMNSSGFAGSGALNAPGNVFLTSTTNDLVIGTTTANGIHFVVNNGVTDAMAISSAGAVTVAGVAVLVNGGALGTPSSGTLTNVTGLPISTGLTGTGTGVLTALAVNVGTAGSFVVNGGAFGTPSSGTLTNATGLPISTGVSGPGTGVETALAVITGSAGALVVNGGALGTPSSGTLTNATGLPVSTGLSGAGTGVLTALGVNTGTAGAFVVNGGALGTPSSGTLTSATGLPISTGISGLGTGVATGLASNATGSGGPVLATSPTITTPGIVGVTNGGNATAGNVGEYISSTVLVGSAVALTSNTATNVTNVSLTAGDWNCEGNVAINPAGTTTTFYMVAWISSNSAVLPTIPNGGSYTASAAAAPAGFSQSLPTGTIRISVSTTTTVFLETWDTFAVSTMSAYGFIGCRRMR